MEEPEKPDNEAQTGFAVRQVFERCYAAGEAIFEAGDQRRCLFVIQAGQVELIRNDGSEDRLVGRFGPGEFFGEMSVLFDRPRSLRAVAVGETRVLEIDGSTFESMCVERPEIAIRVIQRLAARVTDLERRLAALGADDLLRPLVRVILRSAQPGARDARIPTRLRDLAQAGGLTLLEAHRAIGQLLDRRLVRLEQDGLLVPDLDALMASLDPDSSAAQLG